MKLKNIEGISEFNIKHRMQRRHGISAFVRLKDEADFVIPALESIFPWVDEIIIALQGKQGDDTDNIVNAWAWDKWAGLDESTDRHIQIHVVEYPFDSVPNGPGHDAQKRNSVYERAYFYNWCVSQTSCEYVLKWDGDMVAHEWLGQRLIAQTAKRIDGTNFCGTEIVPGFRVSKLHPYTGTETRLFRAACGRYQTGIMCETLNYIGGTVEMLERPGYLHLKYCKRPESMRTAWPENWKEIVHFLKIAQRSEPGDEYGGAIPHYLSGVAL